MEEAIYFEKQYALVRQSRRRLLDYCGTLSEAHLVEELPGFGFSSVRDLLVHINNTYRTWLSRALQQSFVSTSPELLGSLAAIQAEFNKTDVLMESFIGWVRKERPVSFAVERNGQEQLLTPMALFTHVITHEFHHKGQLLTMSRQLGYLPVDTDVIP